MASTGPADHAREDETEAIDFFVEVVDREQLPLVEAGLQRLGCRTERNRLKLHVWLPGQPSFELLSEREAEIVFLASKGLTDKEIAREVKLSTYTVRSYWVRICNKLNAHNRTQAVSIVVASESHFPETPLSA